MKICNKCNFNNDENATFCLKCGTKLITKQKKDIFNILSIISIVLFIVIILANVIIYPLSLRNDESSGMFWFLGVFLPSIPLFFGSIILSIISIVSYFINIIKKNYIQIKKTILVVINIVQLILTISFIFSIPKLLVYIDSYNENFENKDNNTPNEENNISCNYVAKQEAPKDGQIGEYNNAYPINLNFDCEENIIIVDDIIKIIFNKDNFRENEYEHQGYTAKIYINDKLVDTNMFNYSLTNDSGDIVSEDTFTVYKFNDLYFFTNFYAAQCGDANTIITDKNGNILKEIKSFTYTFNSDSTFTIHDYGNCFEISDNKETTYKIDGNSINVVGSINEVQRYTAKTREDFVNYLNNVNISGVAKTEVVYEKLLFIIKNNFIGNDYLLYKNLYNQIEYHNLDDEEYFTNERRFHSIGDNGIVMVAEIGPVGSTSRFLITIFDLDSNVLLTKEVITSSIDNIIVSSEYISYSFETKMSEGFNLDVMAENDEKFCSYLDKNYKDNYVVSGSNKYKYNSKEVILEEKQETTILDYKIKYNCR